MSTQNVFRLELLEDSDNGRSELERRASELAAKIVAKKSVAEKATSGWSPEVVWFNALENYVGARKSWAIFQSIDGYDAKDSGVDAVREATEIPRTCLTQEELQESYTIAVNSALLDHGPWSVDGHWILYDAVATNPNSQFHNTITPEFRHSLLNYAFWENLKLLEPSTISDNRPYRVVEDFLLNHFEELDLVCVPRGISVFERAYRDQHKDTPIFHFRGSWIMSETAVDNYLRFMKQIDERLRDLSISEERFSRLVVPYISAIVEPKCDGDYSGDEEPVAATRLDARLQDPIVQKYMKYVRVAVGSEK